jgi:hypothetical protein
MCPAVVDPRRHGKTADPDHQEALRMIVGAASPAHMQPTALQPVGDEQLKQRSSSGQQYA